MGIQIPITGARGTVGTSLAAIYTVPKVDSQQPYVTVENILFTNSIDDDPFILSLYQNSNNSKTPTLLWSFKSLIAKSFMDSNIKELLYGDSLLAICDKSTVSFVINGFYVKSEIIP